MLVLALATSLTLQAGALNESDEKAAIEQVMLDQQAAWNSGDIPGFMAGYWANEDLRFASGGSITYGWQQTLDRYLSRYDSADKMGQLTFSDYDIRILDEDDALVFGHWQLTRDQDTPQGLFTLHFHKFDEGWRVVHDHTSSAD